MTESENGRPDREILIEVNDLKMHFPIRRGVLKRQVGAIRAVDGITFEIWLIARDCSDKLLAEKACSTISSITSPSKESPF